MSALALGLQHTQNVGPMSKVLLLLLLAMPGGFVIVPALLLLRRRWAKRNLNRSLAAANNAPA